MSALDFIKGDDASDVVFKDAEAVEGEDALTKYEKGRYDGTNYVAVPNMKSFSKASSSKASTRRSSRRLLKAAKPSDISKAVTVSDEIEDSEEEKDQDVGNVVAKVVGKKSKGKKVATKVSMLKNTKVSTSLEGEGVYTPCWNVKPSDTFKFSSVREDVLAHLATPGAKACLEGLDNDALLTKMMVGTCNLAAMLPKGVSRFRKMMAEYGDFAKRKREMKQSLASLKKDAAEYAEKEKTLIGFIDELKKGHEAETAKHEAAGLQVEADRVALNAEKKVFEIEKKRLESSLASALDDNKWLIEEGFQQVVTYLLQSAELNSSLGEVYTKLLIHGKHAGLVAGFKAHESGQVMEESPLYQPNSLEVFKEIVIKMEHSTYLYVSQVSSYYEKLLQELKQLKPEGLNEAVCAKVIEAFSRKRTHSRDNEETLDVDEDVSKDASVEASEAGGLPEKLPKKGKKSKKAKVVKATEEDEASKPSGSGGIA